MENTARRKHFLLLQVNDSVFPIGAYSHSYGLETYIQKGLVRNEEDAWAFLQTRMRYGFCYNEFLSAKLAYEYGSRGDLPALAELEELLDASRIPRETRDAAKKLGSRFIKTVKGMDIPYESTAFLDYCRDREGKITTHSVVYGVFCASVGISEADTMEHFLYAQASAMVTNCVKLIPLSQTSGQHLLYQSQDLFEEILTKLDSLTLDDLCLSAPGFDIRCMQHEGLYSRLYMS